MRTFLANWWDRLTRWTKSVPPALTGRHVSGGFVDAFQRLRVPSAHDLLGQLKSTAFTCATLNAATCASYPPRLYVTTRQGQPAPRWPTRPVEGRRFAHAAAHVEEVVEHPLLTLLQQVNPVHNAFDLWELTTLYQEVLGSAYWHLEFGDDGLPAAIWILPSQHVTPTRAADSPRLVDYYEVRGGSRAQRFAPREVIHFRYPDPRDPYTAGLAPLRAAWEAVTLVSDYAAFKKAQFDNRAVPDVVISPDEVIGEAERDRLEHDWNQKFRQAGNGRVLVAESGLKVQLLTQSMGDLAALAEMGKTREEIANAFHVPLAFLSTETNLANLQAAEHQHLAKAIVPRLRRRDEKLNEQLIPHYDATGRLFLASDDPVPPDRDQALRQLELDLKYGVLSIDEVRAERGLPPRTEKSGVRSQNRVRGRR
jgi:HK97 family phage portal protein